MYKVADNVFEANVCPNYQIKDVKANNGEWSTFSSTVTPEAAKIYTITIAVNGTNVTTIDLSKQEDVYTVESSDPVIIDGGGSSLNKRIIIKENAKVMLKNVVLAAPADEKNTIEVQGTATLLLSGTNEINGAKNGCPLAVTEGTLTINGTNSDNLRLTGEAGDNAGCLGLRNGANLIINAGMIVANGSKGEGAGIGSCWSGITGGEKCGSITINGGIIRATGGNDAAGIGAGAECDCLDIIIKGGNITANGGAKVRFGGAAGIGSGGRSSDKNSTCGNITISGNKTVVTATKSPESNNNDIGIGEGGVCGTVTIKAGATVNNITYTEDHVGRI